jgi:hypothetical protein
MVMKALGEFAYDESAYQLPHQIGTNWTPAFVRDVIANVIDKQFSGKKEDTVIPDEENFWRLFQETWDNFAPDNLPSYKRMEREILNSEPTAPDILNAEMDLIQSTAIKFCVFVLSRAIYHAVYTNRKSSRAVVDNLMKNARLYTMDTESDESLSYCTDIYFSGEDVENMRTLFDDIGHDSGVICVKYLSHLVTRVLRDLALNDYLLASKQGWIAEPFVFIFAYNILKTKAFKKYEKDQNLTSFIKECRALLNDPEAQDNRDLKVIIGSLKKAVDTPLKLIIPTKKTLEFSNTTWRNFGSCSEKNPAKRSLAEELLKTWMSRLDYAKKMEQNT